MDPRTLQSPDKATQHFIVHNIAKKHNVGTLARCATAFGVKSIVLIGSNSYNTFGCKGASNHVDFTYYPTLGEAREGVKRDLGVTKILGVEIVEGAVPIEDHPFDGNTAFIMGNEVGARPREPFPARRWRDVRSLGSLRAVISTRRF